MTTAITIKRPTKAATNVPRQSWMRKIDGSGLFIVVVAKR